MNILEELKTLIKEEELNQWLDTPNQAFDYKKPQELIDSAKQEDIDKLYRMIYQIREGVAN